MNFNDEFKLQQKKTHFSHCLKTYKYYPNKLQNPHTNRMVSY